MSRYSAATSSSVMFGDSSSSQWEREIISGPNSGQQTRPSIIQQNQEDARHRDESQIASLRLHYTAI